MCLCFSISSLTVWMEQQAGRPTVCRATDKSNETELHWIIIKTQCYCQDGFHEASQRNQTRLRPTDELMTGSQQTTRTVIHLLSSRFVSLNVPYQLHEPDVGVLLMECNGSEPCTGSGWRSRSSCSSSSWPGIWGWCTATAPETTQTSSGQSPQINNIHRNKLIIWTDRGH